VVNPLHRDCARIKHRLQTSSISLTQKSSTPRQSPLTEFRDLLVSAPDKATTEEAGKPIDEIAAHKPLL